jgi:UDP-N-acetyl-2-amino-2-deoxyglucuronate dehydrogenase
MNFGLIGAAGFVAPRHMKAIKETGNTLVAALDKFDSVGVLDSYFPQADFFTEFERFDRHVDKLKRRGIHLDYLSVCSPNYLHDSHIRFGLKNGSNVICEKPLVLNPWTLESLQEIEGESEGNVYSILQLRHHPVIQALKNDVAAATNKKREVELTYITSRGNWYYSSWKGDSSKSGGVATNIGIHFYDMLIWLFGDVQENIVHRNTHDRASGYLELAGARVRWFLSINEDTLPTQVREQGKRTYRSILIDGKELEFSEGFTDLHTISYREILAGRGFGIADSLPSIACAYSIRTAKPVALTSDYHPMAKLPLAKHPFEK